MKVKVSNGIDGATSASIIKHSKEKIKSYVIEQNKKDKSFKFYSVGILVQKGKTTKKFLEYRHVCMNCGDVQEMTSYPIAQIAQGHKITYTCDCGHVTTLPQIIK